MVKINSIDYESDAPSQADVIVIPKVPKVIEVTTEPMKVSEIDISILNSGNQNDTSSEDISRNGNIMNQSNQMNATTISSNAPVANVNKNLSVQVRKSNGDNQENKQIDNSRRQDNERNSWEQQKKRGFKRNNRDRNRNNRPEPLRGTNQNVNSIKIAPRMAFLFISGFAPDIRGTDILEFLKSNNMGDGCDCLKIQTKKDKYRSAFRLAVPYDERDQYFSSALWPQGVLVNHFMNLQRQK